jgi:membrane dipeptidase
MFISDAHCDTIVFYTDDPFQSDKAQWNIDEFFANGGRLQGMAIWTDEKYAGDSALRNAVWHIGNFYRHLPNKAELLTSSSDYDEEKVNILLSLEGASPIINDIENIHVFHRLGVRLISLTWNHRNFLADGINNSAGLTPFGRDAVKEMEKLGIIVDVSHLNEQGFSDLTEIAERPFIASHSNCRSVYDHPRNLTDEQLLEIKSRGGYVGVCFYQVMLGNNGNDPVNLFLHQIEHLLELGMEDNIGMGSDFDGADEIIFPDVSSYSTIETLLFNDLLLDKDVIEKILYTNFRNFVLKALK